MVQTKIEDILQIQFVGRSLQKHWSKYNRSELRSMGEALERVLLDNRCSELLFMLDQHHFFDIFIPELAALKKVPQHKHNSSNALHHSILVAKNVQDVPILKWAALLHDIGKAKYKTDASGKMYFRNHEYNGSLDARGLLKRMSVSNKGDICRLIRYHSHPLDYQRQPNWKMSTVKRFCDKHEHLSTMLVDLAIADKISSASKSEYLEDLYKLRKMVEEIQYVGVERGSEV